MPSPWYADPSPTFQPALRLISSITQSNPVVITTSFDHDYISGTIVRINIPLPLVYGMPEIDKLFGPITVTGTDIFTMPIDTTRFQALVIPGIDAAHTYAYPYVTAIGELTSILTAAVQNVLPY